MRLGRAAALAALALVGALLPVPGALGAGTRFFMTPAKDVDCTFTPAGGARPTIVCRSRARRTTVTMGATGRPVVARAPAGASPDRRVLRLGARRTLGGKIRCASTRAGISCRQVAGGFSFLAGRSGVRIGSGAKAAPSAPAPRSAATYCCPGTARSIEEVAEDGSVITLDDGSNWSVDAAGRALAAEWFATTDITVQKTATGYRLTNTEDAETVSAAYTGS